LELKEGLGLFGAQIGFRGKKYGEYLGVKTSGGKHKSLFTEVISQEGLHGISSYPAEKGGLKREYGSRGTKGTRKKKK